MTNSPLDTEIALLQGAKFPDTPENFALVAKRIAELTVPFAATHVTQAFDAMPRRSRPLAAFFLPTTAILAHTAVLQAYFYGLKQLDSVIDAVVFTFGSRKDDLDQALGVECFYFNSGTQQEKWLALQNAALDMRLDALVHVSLSQGLAYASAIRCARKHIWWSMKWRTAVPGVDGYIDTTGGPSMNRGAAAIAPFRNCFTRSSQAQPPSFGRVSRSRPCSAPFAARKKSRLSMFLRCGKYSTVFPIPFSCTQAGGKFRNSATSIASLASGG